MKKTTYILWMILLVTLALLGLALVVYGGLVNEAATAPSLFQTPTLTGRLLGGSLYA